MPIGLTMNDLAFLLVCFIPGFLAMSLASFLVPSRIYTTFDKAATSTALGFAIFTVTIVLGKVLPEYGQRSLFYVITPWLLTVPAAFLWSVIQAQSWLRGLLRVLKLTKRTSGVSCWNRVLSGEGDTWVRLYLDNGFSYTGWVEVYTDVPPYEIVIHPVSRDSEEGKTSQTYKYDDRLYTQAKHIICIEALSSLGEEDRDA